MDPILVALDFDHTVIDDNSDTVARDLLNKPVPKEIEDLHGKNGWTRYMQEIFNLLHQEGLTENDIRKKISGIKPVPDFIDFLKEIKCYGDVIIISDSNSFFINSWLEDNNIIDCINEIFTNPAVFKDGLLEIKEYMCQDFCSLSTVNLCKGHILDTYKEQNRLKGRTYSHTFYVGDGKNDFCPSLRLSCADYVFPREGYCLAELLKKSEEVKAQICTWSHTRDIMDVIKKFTI